MISTIIEHEYRGGGPVQPWDLINIISNVINNT